MTRRRQAAPPKARVTPEVPILDLEDMDEIDEDTFHHLCHDLRPDLTQTEAEEMWEEALAARDEKVIH